MQAFLQRLFTQGTSWKTVLLPEIEKHFADMTGVSSDPCVVGIVWVF